MGEETYHDCVPDMPSPPQQQQKKHQDLSSNPQVLRKRFDKWTSDRRQFSVAVINIARHTAPHSTAYVSGAIVAPRDPTSSIANPRHAFRLQWHLATAKENFPGLTLDREPLAKLSRAHAAANLETIRSLVAKDANYAAQKDRYPHLTALLQQ